MTSKPIKTQILLAMTALLALGFAVKPVIADEVIVTEKRTIHLCGDLFELEANADKLTASERAVIVQKNLDNAIIKAHNKGPSAVTVEIENRHPVVKLDGFHIITADANSAKRKDMTMMALAEYWASKIKDCLSDENAIKTYVSKMTSTTPIASAVVATDKHIIVLKPEMRLPIQIVSGFFNDGATIGDNVTAVISRDIPLETDYKTYLPKGTLVHGKVVNADVYKYNGYPNKDAVTIDFFAMETPDGQEIPISAHIMGDHNQFVMADAKPINSFIPIDQYTNRMDKDNWVVEEPEAAAQGMVDLSKGGKVAAKGFITGSWLGEPYSKEQQHLYTSRLMMDKGSTFVIPAESELLMETHATTSIAVAAPVNVM
ncbi:MAG: hypothetical protein KIT34_00230 [Cyanobacteria bacterium TGS_CYA1]|nr:hypothetical protein [Cyanobacteria bacterium TGS_CYA1]